MVAGLRSTTVPTTSSSWRLTAPTWYRKGMRVVTLYSNRGNTCLVPMNCTTWTRTGFQDHALLAHTLTRRFSAHTVYTVQWGKCATLTWVFTPVKWGRQNLQRGICGTIFHSYVYCLLLVVHHAVTNVKTPRIPGHVRLLRLLLWNRGVDDDLSVSTPSTFVCLLWSMGVQEWEVGSYHPVVTQKNNPGATPLRQIRAQTLWTVPGRIRFQPGMACVFWWQRRGYPSESILVFGRTWSAIFWRRYTRNGRQGHDNSSQLRESGTQVEEAGGVHCAHQVRATKRVLPSMGQF